jgi:hypothetical protein
MRRATILIVALALVLLAGWPAFSVLHHAGGSAQCSRDASRPDVGSQEERVANPTGATDAAQMAAEETRLFRTTAACFEHHHGAPAPPSSTPALPVSTPGPVDGPPGPAPAAK